MSKKKKLLIVDDDEIFIFTAKYVLKKSFPDMEIITGNNGEEALELVKEKAPEVMFLDLNMPIMNGWEVLSRLSGTSGKAPFPIVIVTSSIDPSDREKANDHPFKPAFLEKPLNEENLDELKLMFN